MRARGFTLVELVMVIAITGILAATLTLFLKPAIDSYFDTRRRADLTDMADTALRRMGQDIRRAVPNSIRWVSDTCFELVPTTTGGRYRMAVDTVNAGSLAVDTGVVTTSFDVLNPLATVPANNDWVVVDNQNRDDVYSVGINKQQITLVETPPPAPGGLTVGQHRLTISPLQFPVGYDGGRFVVVANAEQAVFYSCVGNRLYRTVTAFGAAQIASCALTSGAVVATNVASCEFVYDPNQGATQQSGFVWMRLELSDPDSGESVALAHGVHVDNAP